MSIIKSIFYGIISAAGVTVLQQIIIIALGIEIIDTSRLTYPLIFGAFLEEIFKLLFIYRLSLETEDPKKIISNSLFIGFGFSLLELTFKILANSESVLILFSIKYLGIVFIHTLTAGIIGFFLTKKWPLITKIVIGFGVSFALHLIYNYLQIHLF